jgi:hypothetical protein
MAADGPRSAAREKTRKETASGLFKDTILDQPSLWFGRSTDKKATNLSVERPTLWRGISYSNLFGLLASRPQ